MEIQHVGARLRLSKAVVFAIVALATCFSTSQVWAQESDKKVDVYTKVDGNVWFAVSK